MLFSILTVAFNFGKSFILSKFIELVVDHLAQSAEDYTRNKVNDWVAALSAKYPHFMTLDLQNALVADADSIIALTDAVIRAAGHPQTADEKAAIAANVLTTVQKTSAAA